jgi:hypothetical protein
MAGKAYFCSVDKRGSTCEKAFALLFSTGVTNGIPTMIVCDNMTDNIKAIVIGELESVKAWNEIFTAKHNTSIPVYIGLRSRYKLAGYLKPKSEGKVLQELYKLLCVDTLKDSVKVR